MNQPYLGDEALFIKAAKGVAKTGSPIFNQSATLPNIQALWNPPTYVYILGAFISIFGDNVYSVRGVSAIFNLLVVILVYIISLEILKDNKDKKKWIFFDIRTSHN